MYIIVAMKLLIEQSEDDYSWVIMLQDMLGRRRYNNRTYISRDEALDFIKDEFKNDNDILNSIV